MNARAILKNGPVVLETVIYLNSSINIFVWIIKWLLQIVNNKN